METPVVVESAGFQLVGMLHRPDPPASAPQPGVLLLHGFGGQKAEAHRLFVKTARALAQAGFVVMRFDFRGSGDSGGEFEQITVSGWEHDAGEALAWFCRQPGVDAARLGVAGLSTGGAVACHLAARATAVRSLALWSAVAQGEEVLSALTTPESRPHLERFGWADRDGNKVGAEFVREFAAMRPADELARCGCPVLIVHGAADETVPVHQAGLFEAAARAAAGRLVEKLIVPFASHTYANVSHEAQVIEATVRWFRQTL